jgi:chemotaxis protein MotA
MFLVLGIVLGLICIFAGYLLHGGQMAIFVQAWTEYIVILGGALGIFLASNGMGILKTTISELIHMLKPDPFTKTEFLHLLTLLYQIFNVARHDGLLGIEVHLEDPAKSKILGANHLFLHDHHAAAFFCDTMKVIVSGGVKPHDLAEMMEMDLEVAHAEHHLVQDSIQNTGDALPAVGIIACVLGVVITMGKIGGDPAEIGHAVGLALIGTLTGILAAYVLFFPIARAMGMRSRTHGQYLGCIRHAIFSFARGESPMTCIEFARRNIDPSLRPGFSEMEKHVKAAAKGGGH